MFQTIKANKYRKQRVRFAGEIMVEDATEASLFVRVDFDHYRAIAARDSWCVSGPTSWSEASMVLDVSERAGWITLGLSVTGGGTAHMRRLTFEVVDDTVPTTDNPISKALDTLHNMDFQSKGDT
ncbi:MAG TPA: hypothetical protein VG389_28255 [Myxococcota bacterium]|nr:hypothetical protein [Myxococcota bacterium]